MLLPSSFSPTQELRYHCKSVSMKSVKYASRQSRFVFTRLPLLNSAGENRRKHVPSLSDLKTRMGESMSIPDGKRV